MKYQEVGLQDCTVGVCLTLKERQIIIQSQIDLNPPPPSNVGEFRCSTSSPTLRIVVFKKTVFTRSNEYAAIFHCGFTCISWMINEVAHLLMCLRPFASLMHKLSLPIFYIFSGLSFYYRIMRILHILWV